MHAEQAKFQWNDNTLKKLEGFNTQGMSNTEIGLRMGITKNAVIGKKNRMKLKVCNPTGVHVVRKIQPITRPTPTEKPARIYTPPENLKTMADLKRDDCRWPFGDPGESGFGFCGQSQQSNKPYCEHHCVQGYRR